MKNLATTIRIPHLWAMLALLLAPSLYALVNPSLQPINLYERYVYVLSAKVASVDEARGVMQLDVLEVYKGDFPSKQITLEFTPVSEQADDLDPMDEGGASGMEPPEVGQVVVAYVGKTLRRRERDVMIYVGNRIWHEIEMHDTAKPAEWKWIATAEETMVGTFNGSAERFADMMRDVQAGTMFFPAKVYARFKPDHVIAELEQPIGGVALYDIDRDGRLDALAAGENGLRVYLQTAALKFEDRTEALGLASVAGQSVSVADVNADGTPDLLVDATVFLGKDGTFTKSEFSASGADQNLKVSAFVEINGDGLPDLLFSRVGGGLAVFLNSVDTPGTFTDATEQLGLHTEAAGAKGNGYVTVGDWNLDDRTDIFYAEGRGILLEQGEDGTFSPVEQKIYFNFKGGPELTPAVTGAGSFAPIWDVDSSDLVVPGDTDIALTIREAGTLSNVTGYGNEIALAGNSHLATLAHDLDMDGYPDLFTIARDAKSKNVYHTNRGYGSFMHSALYAPDFFPGKSFETGAGGVAAGDANGDGADDLLLGGRDGRLVLVQNDALSLRQGVEHPVYHLKKLIESSIVTVPLQRERGVLGARVTVENEAGQVVALRTVGHAILTGCRGPDTLNIAVREPGAYKVHVRYSDGETAAWPITTTPGAHIRVGGDSAQ
jgi:hypothetical protein